MAATTGGERRELRVFPDLLRGRLWLMGTAVGLSLLSAGGTLVLPLLVRDLVVALGGDGPPTGTLIAMAVLALGSAAASALSGYLLARAGERLVAGVRSAIASHTLRLPLRHVRGEGAGNLVARISADSSQLRSVVDVGAAQLPSSALLAVGTLVVMGVLDWVLLLVVVATFAVASVALGLSIRAIRGGVERQQAAMGRLSQRMTAALLSLPGIKAFRAESQVTRKLTAEVEDTAAAALSVARLQALVGPTMQLGQQLAIVAVMVVSGVRLSTGHLGVAEFAAFLVYLLQLISPLTLLISGVARMQTGLSARRRINEVLTADTEAGAGETAHDAETHPVPGAAAVEFHDVDYEEGSQKVIRGVSFTAPARGLTALVGPSGAGKTTLLALTERFLVPTKGRITVLGRPSDQWPLARLRGRMTYVDQDSTLIEGTVRENLLLGREERIPDAALLQVLEEVGLREAVEVLPGGLDTELGRATDLSGGQRQRLATARAMLGEADLVLFDEPTSQLDSGNEERLRQVMYAMARTRAVVVVAHRLSTVQNADRIVLLDAGAVVDCGTHDELLERCPRYGDLVRGQVLREDVSASAGAVQ